MARSGVSIRYLRAVLPTLIWLFPSSATTDGTRFEPSSPGMTTGVSPCMNATSEFVVPRSIPTMRSVAILYLLSLWLPLCDSVSSVVRGFTFIKNKPKSLTTGDTESHRGSHGGILILQRFVHVPYQVPVIVSPVE